ncbi:histidine phosphatase family protein [Alphaproteobacteria bacterium]|nr:histidine phosphatase family protein [Alphaproteobacteria bacterium]
MSFINTYKLLFFLLNIFLITTLLTQSIIADEGNIKPHIKDNKIIFIRHAYAPGNGDPKNFNIYDCATQRNINLKGINQAQRIGNFFRENKIIIDKVYTSQGCRCKDTAKIAFQRYEIFHALNSFYDIKFAKNRIKQIQELNQFIKNLNNKNNVVFITHYVVIFSLLNITPQSGEIIITDKKLNIQKRIKTM